MHLAAACGCPVVAVWGPMREEHWAPWRARHRLVTPPGSDPAQPSRRRAADVAAADVIAACDELLSASR
jgi:ADP-heptose:LPS heptosyltransferase